MKKILLGVAAAALCVAAGAEEHGGLLDMLHGTYNGGALGHTTISDYCQAGAYTCNDQRDVSFKVFGGLRLTDYLGAEVGYISFGRIRALSQPNGASGGIDERTTRTNGFMADAAPVYRVDQNISLVGRVGLARLHIEGSDNGANFSASKTAPHLGAAFNYKFRDFVPNMLLPALNGVNVEIGWDTMKAKYLGSDHWYNMVSMGFGAEF
ncbi:outer membrane beta-barrel protein [Aquabacterium sp.]|uniref:outer membrane beta-barrel protein n=1 Tax=Aquabacterium sp. TaxID=1872578 RepID=UPI0035B41188